MMSAVSVASFATQKHYSEPRVLKPCVLLDVLLDSRLSDVNHCCLQSSFWHPSVVRCRPVIKLAVATLPPRRRGHGGAVLQVYSPFHNLVSAFS